MYELIGWAPVILGVVLSAILFVLFRRLEMEGTVLNLLLVVLVVGGGAVSVMYTHPYMKKYSGMQSAFTALAQSNPFHARLCKESPEAAKLMEEAMREELLREGRDSTLENLYGTTLHRELMLRSGGVPVDFIISFYEDNRAMTKEKMQNDLTACVKDDFFIDANRDYSTLSKESQDLFFKYYTTMLLAGRGTQDYYSPDVQMYLKMIHSEVFPKTMRQCTREDVRAADRARKNPDTATQEEKLQGCKIMQAFWDELDKLPRDRKALFIQVIVNDSFRKFLSSYM